jgi:hypothetical protein
MLVKGFHCCAPTAHSRAAARRRIVSSAFNVHKKNPIFLRISSSSSTRNDLLLRPPRSMSDENAARSLQEAAALDGLIDMMLEAKSQQEVRVIALNGGVVVHAGRRAAQRPHQSRCFCAFVRSDKKGRRRPHFSTPSTPPPPQPPLKARDRRRAKHRRRRPALLDAHRHAQRQRAVAGRCVFCFGCLGAGTNASPSRKKANTVP